MNFFQPESMRAISTFVQQFRNEPTFNEHMMNMILQFAGGDDVGIALNHISSYLILLEFEKWCIPSFSLATFGTRDVHVGRIHGRVVNFFVEGIKQNGWHLPYALTDTVQVRTNNSNQDQVATLRVCTISMAQWNLERQRQAIVDTLMIQFRNHKSV